MLVTVLATFCQLANPDVCDHDVLITREATLMQCAGAFGEQAISKWMAENIHYRTGWSLQKWGCAIGYQRKSDA